MRFLLLVWSWSLVVSNCFSQKLHAKEVSCPEKLWAITHPFVAGKAFRTTMKVVKVHDSIGTMNILTVQQLNAFKHSYWTALLSNEIGKHRALKLASAHEKGNYRQYKRHKKEDGEIPDKISSEMDFYNNEAGINIWEKHKNESKDVLRDVVIKSVLAGEMKIIKTNSKGQFLRKDNTIIEPSELIGKWENEKCLVNSDYTDK